MTLSLKPIAQDPKYHGFIDRQLLWGIPNFLNVMSNVVFLWIGLWGFKKIFSNHASAKRPATLLGYFLGVLLTCFGSSYYHYDPTNETLFWDRLPMTLAFMSLLGFLLQYRVFLNWGKWLYAPLLFFGAFSVLYWRYTEAQGHGDLRFYGLVQFGALLLTPVILWRFPKSPRNLQGPVLGFLFYALAKVLETFDASIQSLTHLCGGHPLKHLAAGLATYFIGSFMFKETDLSPAPSPTKSE